MNTLENKIGLREKAFFLLILLSLASCSFLHSNKSGRQEISSGLEQEKSQEISNHLQYLGQQYLETIGKNSLINLSPMSQNYLNKMYQQIIENNELVFEKNDKAKFYIIKNKTPFHYSLPGGHYFLSSALIRKYLNNEDLLAAVLAIEIFRSEKGVYEQKTIVPTGDMDTQKIMSFGRVPVGTRVEINKWAYLLMRRAGYDPSALLNFIQIKNKNALDFSLLIGNVSTISREEFNFKNFLSKTVFEKNQDVVERNSARGFYALRQDVLKGEE